MNSDVKSNFDSYFYCFLVFVEFNGKLSVYGRSGNKPEIMHLSIELAFSLGCLSFLSIKESVFINRRYLLGNLGLI